MNVESLAVLVVEACEASKVDYMMTGAFAYGVYAIPRSTKDVDVVVALPEPSALDQIIRQLDDQVDFGGQVNFDIHTWGRRHVGVVREQRQLQVELFELFDDPFVMVGAVCGWRRKGVGIAPAGIAPALHRPPSLLQSCFSWALQAPCASGSSCLHRSPGRGRECGGAGSRQRLWAACFGSSHTRRRFGGIWVGFGSDCSTFAV